MTILLVVGAANLLVPEIQLFLYAEFSGQVRPTFGQDLATYYFGPRVWFDHGLDPYKNINWEQLYQQGAFSFAHPNPAMQDLVARNAGVIGGKRYEIYGYLASPFNLLLFWPLRVIPFGVLYNLWPALSMGGLACVVYALSRRQAAAASLQSPGEAAVNATLLTVFLFPPAHLSAFAFGQLEILYVPLIALVVYTQAYQSGRQLTPVLSGVALALASGAKIFPVVLTLYFVFRAVGKLRREGRAALKDPVVKTAAWAVGASVAVGLFVLGVFGSDLIASWLAKLSSARQAPNIPPQMQPTLYKYCSDVIGGGVGWWAVGAVSVLAGVTALVEMRRSRTDEPARGTERFLLGVSMLLALSPTFMPHWWHYYNVVLAIPMITALFTLMTDSGSSTVAQRRWRRWGGLAVLALAYLSLNEAPWVWAQRLSGIPAAQAQQFGAPGSSWAVVMKYVTGYPGTLLLFVALLMAHRWVFPGQRQAAPPAPRRAT